MRAIAFVAGVLVASPSMTAEQLIFYSASFPDATSVQLSVVNETVFHEKENEFEVAIGLVETDASGAIKYVDRGRHHARIRCTAPAYVSVGTRKYPVGAALRDPQRRDWKQDLWTAFCAVPSS